MSELGLIRSVVKQIKAAGGDATHHEDAVNLGVPDISYTINGFSGWIECKWIKAWPKLENTAVRINHYTLQQREWLLRRSRAGGVCWVLIGVGKGAHSEALLLTEKAARAVGQLTSGQLKYDGRTCLIREVYAVLLKESSKIYEKIYESSELRRILEKMKHRNSLTVEGR